MKTFFDACFSANLEISEYLKNLPQEDFNFDPNLAYNNNQSYKLDFKCEEIFIRHLQGFGQIFSEESGFIGKDNFYKIILDPLDGSSNFVSKIPFYGTSIALFKGDKPQSAFICNLANNEILCSNHNKIFTSNLSTKDYYTPLSNTYSQVGVVEKITLYPTLIDYLSKNGFKFRCLGATALSISYAYYCDFVLILGPRRIFDTAAGLILCQNLYMKKNENFLLISKDKKIFDIILEFFK